MSISIETNANEIIAELGRIDMESARRMARAVREAGDDMRAAWADNARETAGAHGKHYPKSIESRMVGAFESVIAPNESMKQGGMGVGFEFGSVNQPPHLDGQRALDYLAPLIERRFSAQLVF